MLSAIKIVKETKLWLAIDKPAGVPVHDVPGKKHAGKTVADWLLTHYPELKQFDWPDPSRPGIVHRLDADTSGVLLIAKDPLNLKVLQEQFRSRTVEKVYQALVLGRTPEQGELTGMVERVTHDTRQQIKFLKFSWQKSTSKLAFTTFERLAVYQFEDIILSLLELKPKTGRTHQLRVQLANASWPIIGDQLYNTKQSREVSNKLNLHRQFLHATQLTFKDPDNDQLVKLTSPLASDLQTILDFLD